jgi:hypothetical protein
MSKSGKPRGRETFLDMARSMLALGVAVGLVLLVTWRPADTKPTFAPVDAHSVAVGAQSRLAFTPLELDLGKGWKATTAWVERVPTDVSKNHWHVSYVKGETNYVAVDQSDTSSPDSFVKSFVVSKVGTEKIGDVTWKIYSGENEDVIAVQVAEDEVVVITANSYPLLMEALSKTN